jgi:hypothetical protein
MILTSSSDGSMLSDRHVFLLPFPGKRPLHTKTGEASLDIGLSEEDGLRLLLSLFASKSSNRHVFMPLENGHTKQRSQTGNPCHGHNKSLNTVYPHSML